MTKLYEYLDKNNLGISTKVASIINNLPMNKVISILEYCYEYSNTNEYTTQNKSMFSFAVNESLGGSDFPCVESQCRLRNIKNLIDFSILYSDEIMILNPFDYYFYYPKPIMFKNIVQRNYFRQRLINTILIVLELKKPIKDNLIKINNSTRILCKEHSDLLHKEEKKISMDLINYVKDNFIGEIKKYIKIEMFDKNKLRIIGLGKYLSEDVIEIPYIKLPKFLNKYNNYFPSTVSNDVFPYLAFTGTMVDSAIRSILSQKFDPFEGYKYSYLTNSVIESRMINYLNGGNNDNYRLNILKSLKHSLPFLQNVKISTLLKIRKNEQLQFQLYRIALEKTLKETQNLKNQKDYEEALYDIVMPEVLKLNLIFKSAQKKIFQDTLGGAISSAFLFTIGYFYSDKFIYTSLLNCLNICINGLKAQTNLTNVMKLNPYYFLWRIQK